LIILFLLFACSEPAAKPPSDADLAGVFTTLSTLFDAAGAIESHERKTGQLPKAASPVELSHAIFGNEAWVEGLVDGWSTPLYVEIDPARKTYVLASAGADRKFARAEWASPAATRSASSDIVMRNGILVGSPVDWAEEQMRASGRDRVTAVERSLQSSRARRTVSDLRMINVALFAYENDTGRLPEATSIHELAAAFSTQSASPIAKTDAWGTPLQVHVQALPQLIRIVAAGSDRAFSETTWADSTRTSDYARDLVLENGSFVGEWELSPADERVELAFGDFISMREMYKRRGGHSPAVAPALPQASMPAPASPPAARPSTPFTGAPPSRHEGILRVGFDVGAPIVVERIEPAYPEEAKKNNIAGIVILQAVIDKTGKVRDVEVLKGLPLGVSEAAVAAVKKWKFRPATQNGVAVDVVFNLTVNVRPPAK